MEIKGQSYLIDLSPYLVLPSWLADAYDITASEVGKNPWDVANLTGVNPALDIAELNSLVFLISAIQCSLDPVSLRSEVDTVAHAKHSSSPNQKKSFWFERLLQIVHSIGFIDQGASSIRPLFKSVAWKTRPRHPAVLELECHPWGIPRLFGFHEPYGTMAGLVEGQDLKLRPPVIIWKPLWLDLYGKDQATYLRLEMSSQWPSLELAKPQLKSRDLHCLVQGGGNMPISFKKRLSALQRLEKKLDDHRLTARVDRVGYLLPTRSRVNTHWSHCQVRELLSLQGQFMDHAFQFYAIQFREVIPSLVEKYQSSLDVSFVEDVFGRILGGLQKRQNFLGYNLLEKPVFAATLLIEWLVRANADSGWVMPTSIGDRLTKSDCPETCFTNIMNIYSLIRSNTDILEAVLVNPEYSVLNNETTEKPGDDGYTRADQLRANDPEIQTVLYSAARRTGSEIKMGGVSRPVSKKVQQLAGGNAVETNYEAERLIGTIKEKYPQKYQELIKAYLDSLDSDRRKVIKEVRKNLKPEKFDNHIQHSLIRFYRENPSGQRDVTRIATDVQL